MSGNINVGLMDDGRSSSRVLKPPGGGHTDIFGAPEPTKPKPAAKTTQISQLFGNDDNQNANCASRKKHMLTSSIVFNEENENKNPVVNKPTEVIEQVETKTDDNVDNKTTEEVQKPKRVPPGGYTTNFW